VKDRATLSGYVNSQNLNARGPGQAPGSARTSKRSYKGKVLLGEKLRQTVQPYERSEAQFDDYVQSANKHDTQSVSTGAQNLGGLLQDNQSVKDQIQAIKRRNSKDFKIRKTSGVRGKDTDINQFLKKNKYVKVLNLDVIFICSLQERESKLQDMI
jgi:hypothetical protein